LFVMVVMWSAYVDLVNSVCSQKLCGFLVVDLVNSMCLRWSYVWLGHRRLIGVDNA